MQWAEKRSIPQDLFGFSECVISFPPLASQIPIPRSILQLLTHEEVEWCASTPGAMACGLPGWSVEEAGCIPGRWPRPLPLGHSVTMSTQYKYSSWVWHWLLSPCKDQNPRGFMVSYVFSFSISFRSRITCWFSLDLKFQFKNKIQRAFTRLFLTPQRLSSCICVVLYQLHLWIWFCQQILVTRRAGIIICIFHMKKLALKRGALALYWTVGSNLGPTGSSAQPLWVKQHNVSGLILGILSHSCEVFF